MGSLVLPHQGKVYLDANCIIYSYERIEPYRTLLQPCWDAVDQQIIRVVTSELSLLEVLVRPLRTQNTALETGFRTLLQSPDIKMLPINRAILERAARLRATVPSLKTPDAIHGATALQQGCALLITNDAAFRKIPGLAVTLLSDLIMP